MIREAGLFDLDESYHKLSEVSDPLVRLRQLVDFEVFPAALTKALRRSDGAKDGHFTTRRRCSRRWRRKRSTLCRTPPSSSRATACTAYRSKTNEACMARHGLASKVHFRRARGDRPDPAASQGRRRALQGALGDRNRLRRSEATRRALHRRRPRRDQDRPRQHRLRRDPDALAAPTNRVCLTQTDRRPAADASKPTINATNP